MEHLNDKDELTRLENLARKLGFSVDFQSNRSWNNSGVSFYPERLIKIGIRNFDANTNVNVGKGFIPERIKELILAHEIGHILTYKTLYPKLTFEKYVCCSIEFKLWDEIYSWKVALSDTENLDIKELEFAQEQINEYLFCNTIGTRIINEQCELSQKIITKFTKKSKRL